MSVSQVIAAWQGSLNHISHVSGDTCHMMPDFLAPRADAVPVRGGCRAGAVPVECRCGARAVGGLTGLGFAR